MLGQEQKTSTFFYDNKKRNKATLTELIFKRLQGFNVAERITPVSRRKQNVTVRGGKRLETTTVCHDFAMHLLATVIGGGVPCSRQMLPGGKIVVDKMFKSTFVYLPFNKAFIIKNDKGRPVLRAVGTLA